MRTHVEQLLWTLVKGGRSAEARIRETTFGLEFRLVVSGELVWSRPFNADHYTACDSTAATALAGFERAGWRLHG